MANILGTQTVNGIWIVNTDTNPTLTGGIDAPIGSWCLSEDGSGFFYKFGALNTDWEHGASTSSISGANVLLVRKNPTVGQYATIEDAINAITSPSDTNRWLILVGVGQFTENTLVLPNYTSVIGASIQETQIFPATSTQHIFELGVYNEILFMWLEGAGAGYSAIHVNDSGNYSQAHKVTFNNNDINVLVESATQDTIFYGEYLDFNGTYSYGLKVISTNGFEAFANVENYYNFPTGGTTICNYITGTNANVAILAGGCKGINLGTAFYIENGANLQLTSFNINNFDKGIHNPNIGAACSVLINGIVAKDIVTYDIKIEHLTTSGTIGGVFNDTKISLASNLVGLLIQDTDDGSLLITNKLNVLFNDGTITDVSTLIIEGATMGVEKGGVLSDGGGFIVNISQGNGYFELLPDVDIVKRLDWNNTSITLSANVDVFIYFNNNGTLVSNGAQPDTRYNILLGRVVTNGTGIEFIDASPLKSEHSSNLILNNLREAIGSIYSSGSLVTENVTPLNLNVSSGEYYYGENEFIPSGGTGITFTSIYGQGSGVITGQTAVNNTQYDNAGILTALTAGYYAKASLYLVGDGANEKYYFVFAQAEYSTLLAVQQADIPLPPNTFTGSVVLIAGIIVQEGNPNIVQIIDQRPIIGFRAFGVTASADHLSLLNLNGGINGDGGHCFDEKTELLTNKGFIKYTEINDDTVATTLNIEKDALEYQKITGKYVYDNFKELVSIKRKGVEILVTDEHRIILYKKNSKNNKISEKLAKDLKINTEYNIPVTRELLPECVNENTLPDDWFILFGLIISEGHFTISPKTNEATAVTIYQREGEQADYIDDLINKLDIPHTIYIYNGNKSWRIGSSYTRGHILPYLSNKNLSKFLKYTRGNQFRNLLAGLILGDGSVDFNRKNNTTEKTTKLVAIQKIIENKLDLKQNFTYWSINEKLIDDLQELCTLNGLRATKRYKKGGFKDGCWCLSITCKQNITIHSVGKVPYNGNVWCVSVPNTTLVLRRNGVVFICGNSNMFTVNGAKVMTGNLNMGTNNVINAGTFNSVVVESHASRHLPNGLDPLTTAAPTTNLSGTSINSVGIQNSFSRSDHSHAITGAALTKVDDTNVILTLGGSPSTALLNAASLTLGWTGTLSIARGGTNSSTALNNNRLMISSGGSIIEHSPQIVNQIAFYDVNGLPTGSANFTWISASGLLAKGGSSTFTTLNHVFKNSTGVATADVGIYGTGSLTLGTTPLIGDKLAVNGKIRAFVSGSGAALQIDTGALIINSSLTPTSFLDVNGSIAFPLREISAADSFNANDYSIIASGGTYIVTLPTAVGIKNRIYILKNQIGSVKTLSTINGEKIDDATSRNVTSGNFIKVQSNGANWIIIG